MIQGTDIMRLFLWSGAIVAALLLGAVAGYWLRGWAAQDTCLDNGGRWNQQFGYCEQLLTPGELLGSPEGS